MKKSGYKKNKEKQAENIKTPEMQDKTLRVKVTEKVFLEDIPKPEHILVKKPRIEYRKSAVLDYASSRAKEEKYKDE